MNARTVQIVRSVAVLAGTGALIAGATFAASTNTAKTTANTFSASDGLQIQVDGGGDTAPVTWKNSISGFNFTGSIDQSGLAQKIWLKNGTTSALTDIKVDVPTTPTLTNTDASNVDVKFTNHGTATSVTLTLAQLEAAGGASLTGLTLPASGSQQEYDVSLNVHTTGTDVSASSGPFNLEFIGQQ